jgi:6-phosphofructokinase 1
VANLYSKYGGVIVVVSEGLKNADGTPIVKPIFTLGRAIYYGDVSSHLAHLIIKELGIKARSEKPGLIGRCSSKHISEIDRNEAVLMGQVAAQTVLTSQNGFMAGIMRLSNMPYQIEPILIPIEEVMLTERTLPDIFINDQGNGVTPAFLEWITPLVGEIPNYHNFLKAEEENVIQKRTSP